MLSETTEQTAQTSPAIVGKPGASPSSSNWRQGFPSLSNKLRHSFKYLCAVRAHKAIGFGRLRPGRFCSCAPKSVENRRRVTVRAGIAFASPQPHPRFETKAFPKPQNFPLHLPRCLLGGTPVSGSIFCQSVCDRFRADLHRNTRGKGIQRKVAYAGSRRTGNTESHIFSLSLPIAAILKLQPL